MIFPLHVGTGAEMVSSLRDAFRQATLDPSIREIVIHPGTYLEHLVVPPRPTPLLVRSATGRAGDVIISFGLSQGDRDRTGMELVQNCATLTIDANDVTLQDITVQNTFDKAAWPGRPSRQALALRSRGDRLRAVRCRFLGQQDTLLLDSPGWAQVCRAHLIDCYIEGDIDFVYGRATALIEGGEVHSVAPGYVAAPSTAREVPRGLLFHGVRFTGDVPPGSVKLARPWHPGTKPDAVGSAVFSGCELGAHIAAGPWDDMGGYRWQDARFEEHGNTGRGAVGATGRLRGSRFPLEPEAVRGHLDGWDPADPFSSGDAAPPRRQIFIAGDSTASSYGSERAPRTGWGQVLGERVTAVVDNRAISGASSTSFIAAGALDRILAELRCGDLLLVGFGHNDPKPGPRFADIFTQFPAQLRRYIVGARARGAIPVLVTPAERRAFDSAGTALDTHGGYAEAVRALAAEEAVALIDLSAQTRALWQKLGPDASTAMFMHLGAGLWPGYPDGVADNTHFHLDGARAVASLVGVGLHNLGLADLTMSAGLAAAGNNSPGAEPDAPKPGWCTR